MFKSIVSFAMVICCFAGCANPFKDCKNDEDKMSGCIEKRYSEASQTRVETPYKDGKEHGVYKFYYENGEIVEETSYENGKINGILKEYYRDWRS